MSSGPVGTSSTVGGAPNVALSFCIQHVVLLLPILPTQKSIKHKTRENINDYNPFITLLIAYLE